MKTYSERFEKAVSKLYKAFHDDDLNFGDCSACAVGSIVGHGEWYLSSPLEIWSGNYELPLEADIQENNSGYSIIELSNIERIFILAFKDSFDPNDKESQFKGLCAVVEYLCELEGIENIMDYQCLFETENEQPKYKLENVF